MVPERHGWRRFSLRVRWKNPGWRPCTMAISSVNPATGELIKQFEALPDTQVEAKVQLAAATFPVYRKVPFAERARKMIKAAEILETEKDACGRLMTLEMGKPLKAAVAEAAKCATVCRYYAENA